ncbi:MAG TPA: methylmalonyl-CoA mutase family protein [Edaphocola sp.]|nr:methylmalonyl-CoA mutase family protein [Edaphocola sp.]
MENLLNNFEAVTSEDWKEKIKKDLKGITFEQLQRQDDNGISIDPFYTEGIPDATAAFDHTDWEIVSEILVDDEVIANQQALYALNSGASAIYFNINKEGIDWNLLLKGIELNFIKTFIRYPLSISLNTSSLENYITHNNINKDTVDNSIDNIAAYFKTKNKATPFPLDLKETNKIILIDNTIYFNAGTNSVTQLAMALAQLQEYLHLLEKSNKISLIETISIEIATGTSFFEEIAKIRALRQIVALLNQQYNLEIPLYIIAKSGILQKAAYDEYNNLLRDTLSGMAAVLGGCNALCISSFDAANEKGNKEFSLRMAINQQLIFKEESYLNSIADAGNGSYFIEQLTENLAQKAWSIFKEIEQEGGCLDAFDKGLLQQRIRTQASNLIEDYKSGKKLWIGINKYPNPVNSPKPQIGSKPKNNELIEDLNLLEYFTFN